MNPIFMDGRKFAEPMREATIALRNNQRAAIVLAVVDDPFASPDSPHMLRSEAMAELAERLFGTYAFYEFNAATATQISIPRFCRDLRESPACVFVYGLEALSLKDKSRYLNVLQLLNNHREDIRDTCTALALWLSPVTYKDVRTYAPDFADWRTASVNFVAGREDAVPRTVLGGLPIAEADELRHEARRFEEMLQQLDMEPTLAAEFYRQLGQTYARLGQEQESLQALREAARLATEMSNLPQMEQIYVEYVLEQYGSLNPRGISQTVKSVTLPLDEVYISLTAEREQERIAEVEWVKDPELFAALDADFVQRPGRLNRTREMHVEKIDLPRAVRESPRMVLLGDPGAGKTTLAKFLAVCFARACRERSATVRDKDANDYGETRLPVLLRVADYADALRHRPTLTLREHILTSCDNAPITRKALGALFEDDFKNGRMFVLLDGLDEVADAKSRVDVSRHIERFVTEIEAGNRVLVTSRIAGYTEARLSAGFQQYTLRDMEREQIVRFLSQWCAAVERFHTPDASDAVIQQRMEAENTALLQAVDANEGVRRLAGNPLLLTILALIHRNNARLPERRIELYELATRTLLRDWRLANAGAEARVVEEYEALELLGPLAYYMHENEPTGLISEEKARTLLCQYHAETRGLTPTDAKVQEAITDFLRRVREHTGLFVERAPSKYGFMHLTFEEYFAARDIVSDFTQAAPRLSEHRTQARWEEVIRLAIAYERPKNAAHFIRAAIWHKDGDKATTGYVPSEYENILRRDLFLAARCLSDCAAIEPTLAREMAEELVAICLDRDDKGRYWPLQERARAALGELRESEVGEEGQRLLLTTLKDEDRYMRMVAVGALGNVGAGSAEVVQVLLATLKDEDDDVRRASAQALGTSGQGSVEVVQALLAALKDEDWSVRSAATEALGSAGKGTAQALTALLASLNDEDSNVRRAAIHALGTAGNGVAEAVHALLVALKDKDNQTRSAAAVALGTSGQGMAEVVQALLATLKDVHDDVRYAAAGALGTVGQGSAEVMQALATALEEEDGVVQRAVARALGLAGQGKAEVVQALLAALNTKSVNLRYAATEALGSVGADSAEVVQALLAALKDENRKVRNAAARALGIAGQGKAEVVQALLAALKDVHDDTRCAATEALGMVGHESTEALPSLLAALRDEDSSVREAAAGALGTVGQGSAQAVRDLLTTLQDEDNQVRYTAWTALDSLVQR